MFNARTFPCPNCNEIINDSMDKCKYCSAPLNPLSAANAVELQEKVNQACSDASYTKIVAQSLFVFIALGFTPFVSGVGNFGLLGGFLMVPTMAFRWQAKFGKIKTSDPDYLKARRDKNTALIIWLAALPLRFIVVPALLKVIIQALFKN